MLQLLARYRGIIVVSALLVLPLVLLYAQTKKPGARGPVVGVFIDMAALIERGLLGTVGFIVDGIEHYATSVTAYPELAASRRDNFTASALQTRVDELEVQNEELRALAKAVESIDGPRPIAARVVARKGAPLTEIITLDVGSADGVRRGDGVVDRYGVVGLVLSLGRSGCDVLLLSDPSSAIDVVVQRTRARGILRGEGSDERYGARVEDFDKLRNVRPGDAVVTSGLGARFPPGVFVGTVIDAQAPENSLYLRAIVRPAAALDRCEHVSVLIQRPTPKAPRLGREIEAEGVPAATTTDIVDPRGSAPEPVPTARAVVPPVGEAAAVADPPGTADDETERGTADAGVPPPPSVDGGVP